MHGHSYRVELKVEGPVDPRHRLRRRFLRLSNRPSGLSGELDHHCLNEIEGLENPTAENIAVWIFDRVKKALPQLSGVIVYETKDCYAEYYGE